MITAHSLLRETIEMSEDLADIVYQCQVCGACDVNCHMHMEGFVEPLDVIRELRMWAVSHGHAIPEAQMIIENLKKEDNTLGKPKGERGNWASGLNVKDLTQEKAEIALHVGCCISFHDELWPVAKGAVKLLQKVGADFGILGTDEVCCGGRAHNLGYAGEFTKYAESNRDAWRTASAKKIITLCADGYGTLVNLYPKVLKDFQFEVLHITQFLEQLIDQGRLNPASAVPMRVTYHDPCNLGRLGEKVAPWEGIERKFVGPRIEWDPPKHPRHGLGGVYEPPRNVLRSIPGIELVEMERIKSYSFCSGAGGGVIETFPDFALDTARERLREAKATGADAIVTACPWAERNFTRATNEFNEGIKVYDVVELLAESIQF